MIATRAYSLYLGFAWGAITVLAMVASSNVFAQEKAEPQAAAWNFVFRVVDYDEVVLKNATIKTEVNEKSDIHQQLPNGDFRITFDSKPKHLSLHCESDGKTPINVTWRENEIRESSEEVFVVTLPTPKPIGGRIEDEDGAPIEGATVYVLASRDRRRLHPAIRDYPCQTDAQGRWSCPVTPPDLWDISIRLEHPDYISDATYGGTVRDVSTGWLQASPHVAVMRKGTTVSGKVTGPDGKPVFNAAVLQGRSRFGTHYPETETDKDGNFAFTNCAEGKMVLTVLAKDLAPELIEIDVVEDFVEPGPLSVVELANCCSDVDVELTLGKTLTIKVVDPDGNPVPNARIQVVTWRGNRSLGDAELPSRTDKHGVLEWKNAPEDALKCHVSAKGFLNLRGVEFTAREEPYIINLVRSLVFKGTVVEAETGKSIENFKVVPQLSNLGHPAQPMHSQAIDGRDGKYELEISYAGLRRPEKSHSILIEANGYAPQVSTAFKSDQGEVKFDFKMVKAPGISGTVVSESGLPVKGAVVVLSTPRNFVTINRGRMLNLNYQPSTRTAEDGGFSLVSRKGKWRLCVCHDLGFATVESGDFEVGQTLKLLPWSVVAGKDLKSVGSQTPVTIALSSPAQAWLSQSGVAIAQYATVNSEGDFEFNRVAPGFTYFIERLDSTQKRLAAPGRYTGRGKTEAGARHQILLGQPGRKVIGELKFDGRRIQAFGFARARVQRPEYPEGFDQWDEARRSQWQEQWS